MKKILYIPILLSLFILIGCEPSSQEMMEIQKSNSASLQQPTIVGTTEDNILFKRYTLLYADSGCCHKHYVYVAIQGTNVIPTTTNNYREQSGQTSVDRVEVIVNGTHMIATPVEKH